MLYRDKGRVLTAGVVAPESQLPAFSDGLRFFESRLVGSSMFHSAPFPTFQEF